MGKQISIDQCYDFAHRAYRYIFIMTVSTTYAWTVILVQMYVRVHGYVGRCYPRNRLTAWSAQVG